MLSESRLILWLESSLVTNRPDSFREFLTNFCAKGGVQDAALGGWLQPAIGGGEGVDTQDCLNADAGAASPVRPIAYR